MKPIILITPSLVDNERFLRVARGYTEAIEKAGGIAIIPDLAETSNISRLLDISDGLLLSGGCDIDPSFFGEAPMKEIGEISPMRDEFEISLANSAASANMPILAICRGAQVLNIAFGGKVFQDIYAQLKTPVIKHSQEMPGQYPFHSVRLAEGSLIRRIMKADEIRVNSFHHQAVSLIGRGMKITASSCDGVVEAIECSGLDFCVGVQWHPERMIHKFAAQLDIFKEFISHAQNNIQRKM